MAVCRFIISVISHGGLVLHTDKRQMQLSSSLQGNVCSFLKLLVICWCEIKYRFNLTDNVMTIGKKLGGKF